MAIVIRIITRSFSLALCMFLAGCESDDGVVPAPTLPPPVAAPEPAPAEEPTGPPATSYELQASRLLTDWTEFHSGEEDHYPHSHGVAYGDFDMDGDEDVLLASSAPWDTPHPVPPAQMELFLNMGDDGFRLSDDLFLDGVPSFIHARKLISGDFNADGMLDIFVVASGSRWAAFPREVPVMLLSNDDGWEQVPGLAALAGHHYAAASADIDMDGDVDIIVADDRAPFALLNDGTGQFTYDESPVPVDLTSTARMERVELIYVDDDPFVDLVVAGLEYEGMVSRIYWGDGSGSYAGAEMTDLAAVEGWGQVLDIEAEDLDKDGLKEVILNRTATDPAADGHYIQVLSCEEQRVFNDETEAFIRNGSSTVPERLLQWLRVIDVNGDGWLDIFVDDNDTNHGLTWLNDGEGVLSPGPRQ